MTPQTTDTMDADRLNRLAAVLGHPHVDRRTVPPLWHWAFFTRWPAADQLGEDGHPRRHDGFATTHPRRMFAGARLCWTTPLRTGDPVTRTTDTARPRTVEGRSGTFVLVTQKHTYRQQGRVALVEEQDIVYRNTPLRTPPAATSASPTGQNCGTLRFDPVQLFRFSAVTGNAHRIHYDRDYAGSEGYPGLVVHGPLLALRLLDRAVGTATVSRLAFRARSPVFVDDEVTCIGEASWPPQRIHGAVRGHVAMTLEIQRQEPA